MKNRNKIKLDVRSIMIVLALIIGFNSFNIFTLYHFRLNGDLHFDDTVAHIFAFFLSVSSVVSTLVGWRVCQKLETFLKIVISFIVSSILFSLVEMSFHYITRTLIYGMPSGWNMLFGNVPFNFLTIHIPISITAIIYINLTESRKANAALQIAQKEKENLQLRVLRKNLEPHFLFNNLNVLSGLAKKNPEKIDDFIDDFSEVYRYYLKNDKQDVVPLSEEETFLKQYMNLIKTRFGKAYHLQLNIKNKEGFIIPCAIQLCVENAIKHNKGSEEQPLVIRVSDENNSIIIANKLNKVDFTVGTKTGNTYLKNQYKILFDKEVIVTESNEEFIVKIPIIN